MKTAFLADDGTPFEDQAACEKYEAMTYVRGRIREWADEAYADKKGVATRVTNNAVAWETVRDEVLGLDKADIDNSAGAAEAA